MITHKSFQPTVFTMNMPALDGSKWIGVRFLQQNLKITFMQVFVSDDSIKTAELTMYPTIQMRHFDLSFFMVFSWSLIFSFKADMTSAADPPKVSSLK